ncbi:MAG TPA: YceD family protein [Acidimicrobiales bacterium]|nr:YceD family protein [Acidimicrobiales bacterium]
MARAFIVPAAGTAHRPGARREVTLAGPLDLAVSTTRLTADDVVADVVLEGQGETLTVSGTVRARWTGECRRCLEPTGGEVAVRLSEVFEPHPVDGETYALGRDEVDLEPALREALALALPLAPLCSETCGGPDPEGHPVEVASEATPARRPADPRWHVLDALRFEDG